MIGVVLETIAAAALLGFVLAWTLAIWTVIGDVERGMRTGRLAADGPSGADLVDA
jgi:hypothetical protein